MNRRLRFALAAYLALWATIGGSVIYGIVHAGYSASLAVVFSSLLFVCVNGSFAYRARSRQLRSQGEQPPTYLQYLFFPRGFPKLKQEASKSTHLLVGIAAALLGVFFVFCGVALAFDAEWSRISQPFLAVAFCIVLASMGAAFLWLAWRLLSFARQPRVDVA